MAFTSIVRALQRSPLTEEFLGRLDRDRQLIFSGAAQLPKAFTISALAQARGRSLLVVTATLEEASRWAAQMEEMGFGALHFYPTSEASPYEPFDPEQETLWGQLQVLADLRGRSLHSDPKPIAIVTTERALQPHLPPVAAFDPYCINLEPGAESDLSDLGRKLARLGYERVSLVETEGQWSQRGDIIDVFPVSSELPVRLEWFGDALERIREFDPANQRSLDPVARVVLTPTDFGPIVRAALGWEPEPVDEPEAEAELRSDAEGVRRLLGRAFEQPACLLDYLPEGTIVAIDEIDHCGAHADRWVEQVGEHWSIVNQHPDSLPHGEPLRPIHRTFGEVLAALDRFDRFFLSELATEVASPLIANPPRPINLASRPVPPTPHQFSKLADFIRGEVDRKFAIWLLSAQPSRSVALLQEHDCPAQFVPSPRDFQAIDRLQGNHTPVAVKYSGLAELEGFVLPTYRITVLTDREFFGQHALATPGYVRKRRRATSKQVDPNKLAPGDYVVHRNHGIGRFLKLEKIVFDNQTREYLVLQYADGLLRVAADQVGSLSRYRRTQDSPPELHRMTGKAWEKTKAKVRKTIKKLAVDLLQLYAARSEQRGVALPPDMPWQQELEDSFPYQPTPDQLKATQDVKRDMESDRPMDRLVCGDVGFGKTEVAVRAIFKAVTAGKQCALLAPTTILTQQHYHTLKERFAPYPIQIGLMNRFRSPQERKEIQRRLATGELDIVVGTHALLSKSTQFKDLGLLVVDEEQRFGVNQKEKIKALKTQVDVLTLSATPIPRTLYMALSGIREMSLITTPPPNRRPIQTHLAPYDPEAVRSAIRQELDRGGQIFYVVPRVEGIEKVATQLVELVPSLRIAIAHGQMDEGELEATMLSFGSGEADILVCTTIVESGLDIPRVNTILIEDAEKFGLSQLYQLRGRVGRAGVQAHAWLFYNRQGLLSEAARKRLRAIQEFTQLGSGYQLAMRDMEIRGVGNLLGAEQSGQMEAIGFDLYMEMLQEAIDEIRGQAIPQVDDTQIDLHLTAFIPNDYIPDLEQKMSAYRSVAAASSKRELTEIAADWSDRYGPIPPACLQLLRVMELKQTAKQLGFSRIRIENKQHVILETPMEEPAWKLLAENLPDHLRSRFVYMPKKVMVRGLGVVKPEQQLDNLIDWLGRMQGALPEAPLKAS
ncbi:transcription-repair coupling factor [Limnothrix redekei]|uniref:Transcription-repair-coupling factor n=1 Tax=Limnothrix redekei LRLZ20PSL1 TaxID=3112953 RepID=A0ABW7CA40_9CYAN